MEDALSRDACSLEGRVDAYRLAASYGVNAVLGRMRALVVRLPVDDQARLVELLADQAAHHHVCTEGAIEVRDGAVDEELRVGGRALHRGRGDAVLRLDREEPVERIATLQ